VLGVRIDALTIDSLNRRIAEIVRSHRRALVLNVNVHAMNLCHRLGWFAALLERAEIVFCDGAGVALAARILGRRVPERITYADWIWTLAETAAASQLKLFFLGGKEGVAERATERLRARRPGLEIVGCHHGYFDKRQDADENLGVVEAINDSGANILIVAFGMPLQERWLMENWDALRVNVGLTGGAVFDYVSGDLRRGPRWMTQNHLEWLARLLIEPKRLWRRYLLGLPPFFWRVVVARLRGD
jgi:N-acetylglucosaminyldiphosphoundecaprenol N-acetyl-beta-D-mannosaminyltransferase